MQNNQKIPKGWSVKKLGEVCIKKGQYGANAPAVPYNCSLPTYLRITDIDEDGQYSILNRASVDISDYKNYLLKKGDIVFARTGATTGKTYLYKEKDGCLVFAGFLIKFSPNNSLINPYYLKLLTCTPLYNHWVEIMSVRSGQPGINADEYAQYPLLLPPLPEQEKIAGILGTWDEAIEKLSALIEQKKLLKKGLMQKLLTGKTRLPGFTQPWKEVKLKEMGHITSAGVDKNIVPGEQNVILLNYMDVYRKDFIYKDDIKQIVTAPDSKIKNCNVLMGDVFFTPSSETRDDIGHSAVIMENIPGAVYSYHVVRFRPLLNHLSRDFCAYAFKTSKFYKQAYSLCEGSGQRYVLSQDYFRNMSVFIPTDLKEQQAIADVLSTVDDEINLLNQKLEALKEQKKGLMQQLLTGRVRVKVN